MTHQKIKFLSKVVVVAVVALVGYWGANAFDEGINDSVAGVLYLGNSTCSGVEGRGEDNLKCAVDLGLQGSRLPELDRGAASALRSVELTHVETVELSRCPPSPSTELAGEGANATNTKSPLLNLGASPCRVHEGSDRGLSLRNAQDSDLGVIAMDELLWPGADANGSRRIALLSTGVNEIALVEQTSTLLRAAIVIRPEQDATLSVSPGAAWTLSADVSQRVVALTPAAGTVRVNLGWRVGPTLLWRHVRLTELSGPLAAKSTFDWLGHEYSPSQGTILVKASDLEASISLACGGNCFEVAFNATHAAISGKGTTINGRSSAALHKFEAFAAICGLLLGLVALFFK